MATGVGAGIGVAGVSATAYYLGKAFGWWGSKKMPGGKVVLGSSLAYHDSLDFEAYSCNEVSNKVVWGQRYYYRSNDATNKNMREAILKDLLFKNDDSGDAKKKLENYLSNGGLKDYVIFRLEACGKDPDKYVIVFDASLFGKMAQEQNDAIKDKVYENGGFAVLGVEVRENKQGKNANYNCTIKNLGELGYSFYFGTQSKCYIFNKKEDNNAVKNEKLDDSLSLLPIASLCVFSSNKKCVAIKDNDKQKFIRAC